jgi:hypothetical protein
VQHAEDQREQRHDAGHQQQVMGEPGIDVGLGRGQNPAQQGQPLGRQAGARLAQVVAAGIEEQHREQIGP